MRRYGMIGGGATMGFVGVGVLVLQHWEFLVPLTPDIVGVAFTLTGSGLLAAAMAEGGAKAGSRPGRSSAASKGKKSEFAIELVPLADEKRYAAAADAIAHAGEPAAGERGGSGHVHGAMSGEAEDALVAAEESEATALEASQKERAAAALTELKEALANGTPPRRLRQKLAPRVFVIDFDTRPPAGPSGGGAPPRPPSTRRLLDDLREQVSLLVHVASPYDEVVLRVTSPGGAVTDYGLAAAHFARLKAAGVRTTACVDVVAASGGYMIACAADTLLAAPFSIVGSIGVIAGVPNVHRLLERGGVEYVQRTAGEYKRTVNIFTPNTEEGLQKFEDDLSKVHDAFVTHVTTHRGDRINAAEVCTGETWLALHAQPLGLVDGVMTSDEYLRQRSTEADVYLLRPVPERRERGLMALLSRTAAAATALSETVASVVSTPFAAWRAPWMAHNDGSAQGRLHADGSVFPVPGEPGGEVVASVLAHLRHRQ